jgi:hypothetical protein
MPYEQPIIHLKDLSDPSKPFSIIDIFGKDDAEVLEAAKHWMEKKYGGTITTTDRLMKSINKTARMVFSTETNEFLTWFLNNK